MKESIEQGMKKMTMAGVGMAASVAEKTKDMIDKYADKGEQLINNNDDISNFKNKVSELTEESAQKISDAMDTIKDKADSTVESMKHKISDTMK